MTPGLTTIVIPTYNHGKYVQEAVHSALAQTVPCEVIVVDDGSTDDTEAVLSHYRGRIRYMRIEHAGPSAARNAGIEAAKGEFVMLLDADDVIAPNKVETQVKGFSDEIGWVLCDVRIEDEAKGKAENASEKYDYATKDLGGWIQPLLREANIIPIMSPLVRRSVLGDSIRFRDDRVPEDWHFWNAVAGVARVRYVPKVLATYRHRRTGRSRLPKEARKVAPNYEAPLRLNLGCGTQGTRSWHPMPKLVNLDKSMGWRFEDGLPDFLDGSVAGITISHALMYVPEQYWPLVFSEFARVLAPGGVVRITEDDATDPKSSRVGGWKGSDPAVTLTDPAMVRKYLERAGFTAYEVTRDESLYPDASLCQAQHGEAPDVFFIEGVRENAILFAPHNDDETLFAAFTVLRYRPRVVVCFESSGDYGDPEKRLAESRDAGAVLGAASVEQWKGGDLVAQMRALDARDRPSRVFAPDPKASHPDHVATAEAAAEVFGDRLTTYHTYDKKGKVRTGRLVTFEPAWIQQKLRALARYTTQIRHERAHEFFTWDLREYYGGKR